ncbi:hypothetical protein IAT40_007155 [Kwoniella sp. CBS 6097]
MSMSLSVRPGPSSLHCRIQPRNRTRIQGPRSGFQSQIHVCASRAAPTSTTSSNSKTKTNSGPTETRPPSSIFKPRVKATSPTPTPTPTRSQSKSDTNTSPIPHHSSQRAHLPSNAPSTSSSTATATSASASASAPVSASASAPVSATLPNDPQWPWRPVVLTKFEKRFKSRMEPDPKDGGRPTATEYRTIFTRPLPSSPWKRILLATSITWLGCVWFIIPDKPRVEGLDEQDVGYGRYIAGTTANLLLDQIPFIAFAGAVLSLNKTFRLLRVVTRLEQVRAPASPADPLQGQGQRVWVRMRTGRSKLDALVPSKKEYREFEIADIGLSGVRSAQGPVLDLKITPSDPKVKSWNRDRRPYWMDLRDSPQATLDAEKSGKDYVVSLNRLQQVFGKIDWSN